MSKISLVFSTLYPQNFNERKACCNTLRFIEEWRGKYSDRCDLRIIAGSAYPEVVEEMNKVIRDTDKEVGDTSYIFHCPFKLLHNMTERRGHEISFSKKYIFEKLAEQKFDYVYFVDSDVYMSFTDMWNHLEKLYNKPNHFIQFPYTLRKSVGTAPDQFGVYVLPEKLVKPEYASVIYETGYTEKGKLRRKGAPDCRLLKKLLKSGGKRIRATQVKNLHYDKDMIYIYDNGSSTKVNRSIND